MKTTTNIPMAYRFLADSILASARESGTEWNTSGKVYLSTIPAIDLTDPECLQDLAALRSCGALRFARADFVQAMDPGLVTASTWRTEGATAHFLCV